LYSHHPNKILEIFVTFSFFLFFFLFSSVKYIKSQIAHHVTTIFFQIHSLKMWVFSHVAIN
jgi:hypothetical protein